MIEVADTTPVIIGVGQYSERVGEPGYQGLNYMALGGRALAEAIADITSSGETLRANHLRPLEDGLVHKSQATLFRARRADWGPETRAAWAALRDRLGL